MVNDVQILNVALADIEVLEGWNTRSGNWAEDLEDPTSDDGGFEGLKKSMAESRVNKTPVLLRPRANHDRECKLHDDSNWKKSLRNSLRTFGPMPDCSCHPLYILVDGFRRYRAATELGLPYLRAIVEEMTDFEARMRNIQAGVGPSRFKTADLAWAIHDLKTLGGPKCTYESIARLVGCSTSYASQLGYIMANVDPQVTTAWRASSVKVDPQELRALGVLPREQHKAKWEYLLLDQQTKPHGKSRATAELRMLEKARERGRELRALEDAGVFSDLDRNFTRAVSVFFPTAAFDKVSKLSEAIQEGYEEKRK